MPLSIIQSGLKGLLKDKYNGEIICNVVDSLHEKKAETIDWYGNSYRF